MGYYPRERTSGVRAAVAIHLGVYCVVAGCLAYGLHALFEPLQLANPGLSAYKPPPGTVITYVPARSHDAPQPVAPVAEAEPALPPEPVTTATTKATPAPAAAETRKRTAKAAKPRRARATKVRRDPRLDYAYQPSYFWGGYRPWY